MLFSKKNYPGFLGTAETGLERIQLLVFLAILIGFAAILAPTLLKQYQAETDLRMKVLLRAFHSANEVYRQHNTAEGYAHEIADLVHPKGKVRYLGATWLNPTLDGFAIVYKTDALVPRQSFSLTASRGGTFFKSSFCIDQMGVLRSERAHEAAGEPLTGNTNGCHGGIEVV